MQSELATSLGVRPEQVVQNPNVVWLDTEGQPIKRSDVMQVLQELTLSAFDAGQERWIILHDAHLLTPEAGNALLKVLEEPPAHTRLILLSPSAASVLPTLRSRTGLRVLSGSFMASKADPEAERFMQTTIGERLSIIGQAHKSKRLAGLVDALAAHVYATQDMSSLAWFEDYYTNSTGQNTRLLLEAFSLREWMT